MKTRQGEEEE